MVLHRIRASFHLHCSINFYSAGPASSQAYNRHQIDGLEKFKQPLVTFFQKKTIAQHRFMLCFRLESAVVKMEHLFVDA